jgi:hypothetical protein
MFAHFAQEGLWPVAGYIVPGSVNCQLLFDEAMVFVNPASAIALERF